MRFYRVFNCILSRSKGANSELTTVFYSLFLPFLLYGFDAVNMSDANTRSLDRCLDRAVYRIFAVCDKDNVAFLRTSLGLLSVSKLVKKRRAKFLDGLIGTDFATLMHIYCINCLN